MTTKPTKANAKELSDSKLQKLVKKNPNFTFIETGKIKCILTGHQFAPTFDNYQQYLKSKSYKRGVEGQFDISEYEEFLVDFKGSPHFLFCRLTGAKIPKKKTSIEKHVNSRKFKYRMEQIKAESEDQEEQQQRKMEEHDEQPEQQEEEQEVQKPRKVKKGKKAIKK